MNAQVIEFLKNNPNSDKATISEATGMKGLHLFNVLKGMVKEGQITISGEGDHATYSLPSSEAVQEKETNAEVSRENPNNEEAKEETAGEQAEKVTEQRTETGAKTAKKQAGRNTGTYNFNGTSYNKGKLIHAVVSTYWASHKNITLDKLKEVFPDTLLKRFGIFQTLEKAREISGPKYDRYFFKEEFQIKLKDATICTCNQITGENILPFLTVAREQLGYKIEEE